MTGCFSALAAGYPWSSMKVYEGPIRDLLCNLGSFNEPYPYGAQLIAWLTLTKIAATSHHIRAFVCTSEDTVLDNGVRTTNQIRDAYQMNPLTMPPPQL